MALAVSRHLLDILKYQKLKHLYKTSARLLRSSSNYELQPDENAVKLKTNEVENNDNRINISDKELNWMYENKIYNSETWKMVMRYKKQENVTKFDYWKSVMDNSGDQILFSDPDRNLSVAAKMLLKSSNNYPNIVSEGSDIKSVPQHLDDHCNSTESEIQNYPFAFSDVEKRRDKLLLKKSANSTETILHETVAPNALPDVPGAFSTEKPNDSSVATTEKLPWKIFYGTPNSTIPITKIPCGGCGAYLHCQNESIAGYLPSEILTKMSNIELQDVLCQRCSFLQDYNIALNLSVPPETYSEIISKIKEKPSLIVLMVDLLDFPCSIWPGIIDLVGPEQPILVVGNKVDLLPKDGFDYLVRMKRILAESLKKYGIDNGMNIRNVRLISARTGYGIEELISDIHKNWGTTGDIYVIGCTNVGKSTLFNALLQSDLCKAQAMDLIQRATISIWPGTTLNLLKFPVMRPAAWRVALRKKRLESWKYLLQQEQQLRQLKLKETKDPEYATLIGHVGLTFTNDEVSEAVTASKDAFQLASSSRGDIPKRRLCKFDPDDYEYKSGKWVYDTPGSVHKDQIITLLTMEELSWTLPNCYTPPRCFVLRPGHTLFLAGLGRLDYIEGAKSIVMMLFSSPHLPVSIMKTQLADQFYSNYLGTEIMKVPFGDFKRLKDFPALVPKEFNITGEGWKHCCADILFSSAGWTSIAYETGLEAKFLAYTPEGRGCHLRLPALLQHAIRLRGERISHTPACTPSKVSIEKVKKMNE
ncbi:hypothetical protein CHUAL_010015 [Chamberlinius hualienensis]